MENLSLTSGLLFLLMLGAGIASSAITLIVIHIAVKCRYGPEFERKLDERMKAGVQLIQEGIRERLRERARDLARTGMGLFAGKRTPRDEYDDDGDL